ncbi:hypothetical protein [Deinococcus soli (ex Cha et al. 2016)]|uniref:hypothetical protein n=1 Tax=Deinococcus soli (ex Cha et al. 2016) TaxID=1309411 RepID=UPI00166A620E|nr:hypothetical protein [Deinococcus soli (ex Cha et al. 2016)]GGB69436.1 hypothetical protein GCM10008019_27010 [Deinococcus soli (ex Cha et al. 2016)]
MPEPTAPQHTPYTGPLPISIEDYLDGDHRRHLKVRRATPDADEQSPVVASHTYYVFLISEEGWALATHRTGGTSAAGAIRAMQKRGPIKHVQPRLNADGTAFV